MSGDGDELPGGDIQVKVAQCVGFYDIGAKYLAHQLQFDHARSIASRPMAKLQISDAPSQMMPRTASAGGTCDARIAGPNTAI